MFDNYNAMLMVKDKPVNLELFDTAGQEEYDQLRQLSFPQTDVFLVCFSVVNRNSFENVKDRWIPEIRGFSATVPIILVGTKIDLRDNPVSKDELVAAGGGEPIAYGEGDDRRKSIGAIKYMECSALTQKGLMEIFTEVATSSAAPISRPSRKRCILL